MDPESKRLLQETLELSRENNRMLRAMRRAAFWGGVFRVIWWAVIIGVPVVLYYYVFQPYIAELQSTYQSVKGGAEQLQLLGKDIPEPFRSFLNNSGFSL